MTSSSPSTVSDAWLRDTRLSSGSTTSPSVRPIFSDRARPESERVALRAVRSRHEDEARLARRGAPVAEGFVGGLVGHEGIVRFEDGSRETVPFPEIACRRVLRTDQRRSACAGAAE
jgi:hypothetical protein